MKDIEDDIRNTINRTKVELKFTIAACSYAEFVPYQSYQSGIEMDFFPTTLHICITINRTKVELKYFMGNLLAFFVHAINRTKVELKCHRFISSRSAIKFYQSYQSGIEIECLKGYWKWSAILSIVPKWN